MIAALILALANVVTVGPQAPYTLTPGTGTYSTFAGCVAAAGSAVPGAYACASSTPVVVTVPPTDGYVFCAAEGGTCALPSTSPRTPGMTMIYGAGTLPGTWSTAKHVTSATACSNAVFGDPDYGVVKSCWTKYDPPDLQDMTGGVPIDMTRAPAMPTLATPWGAGHQVNNRDIRVASPRNADGSIVLPYVVGPSGDGVGAFRTNCFQGVMAKNDPLVYPGQAGASHLHSIAGNMGFDENLTTANQRSVENLTKGSTCPGGTLNMSNYWVPTMIDFASPNAAGQGVPMAFSSMNVYYKRGYLIGKPTPIAAVPAGLHVITGNAKNVNPAGADHSRFICMGPKGENPGWTLSIDAAMIAARATGMGNCAAGSDFIIEVNFPQCWDGVNLDSPNHASHMSDPVQVKLMGANGVASYPWQCPADHPVALPSISFNVHYPVAANGAPDHWRLSSDAYDETLPRGLSSHGDYFFGWDAAVRDQWTKACVQNSNDCHDNLLGDDTYLGN